MNKENLLKLADYLENNVTQEQFHMHTFRQRPNRATGGLNSLGFVSLNDCGTIGCAAGWGPFVKGLELIKNDFKAYSDKPTVDFVTEYIPRVFGIEMEHEEWDFVFSGAWEKFDNTPKGAANRIKYLVENGLPDNFEVYILDEASNDSADLEFNEIIENIVKLYNKG